MQPDYSYTSLTYARQLMYLLGVIIAIGFLYGLVPPVYTPVRVALALAQFGLMALTMWITIQRVLEDY